VQVHEIAYRKPGELKVVDALSLHNLVELSNGFKLYDYSIVYNDIRDVCTDIFPAVNERKYTLPFERNAKIIELDRECTFVCAFQETGTESAMYYKRSLQHLIGKRMIK
jgi:hypothetical protein